MAVPQRNFYTYSIQSLWPGKTNIFLLQQGKAIIIFVSPHIREWTFCACLIFSIYVTHLPKANFLPVSEGHLAQQTVSAFHTAYSWLCLPQTSSELGWENVFELDEPSRMAKELSLGPLLLKSASLHHVADALPLYHMEVTPHRRKIMSRSKLPQQEKKNHPNSNLSSKEQQKRTPLGKGPSQDSAPNAVGNKWQV